MPIKSKFQILRSTVAGRKPANGSQDVGVLYANLADKQLGIFDANKNPMDLLSVLIYDSGADYPANKLVEKNGAIFRAKGNIVAGNWDATKWSPVSGDMNTLLPLDGSRSMTGPLSLDPNVNKALNFDFGGTKFDVISYTRPNNVIFGGDISTNQLRANTEICSILKGSKKFSITAAKTEIMGNLTIATAPVNADHAVNKGYVDGKSAKNPSGYTRLPNGILIQWKTFTPSSNKILAGKVDFPTQWQTLWYVAINDANSDAHAALVKADINRSTNKELHYSYQSNSAPQPVSIFAIGM